MVSPLVSVITPTGDRPEALRLCSIWLERQVFYPRFEWIVVDDGEDPASVFCSSADRVVFHHRRNSDRPSGGHTLAQNLLKALDSVRGDLVLIVEDDDWYGPRYLDAMYQTWCVSGMPALVGQAPSIYYHLPTRQWRRHPNKNHCSLCQTGFRKTEIGNIRELLLDTGAIDMRLWAAYPDKEKVVIRDVEPKRGVLGIKGMPGRLGIGSGHRPAGDEWVDDKDLGLLKAWIRDEISYYEDHMSRRL